jgi:DNA polymerase
MPIPPEPAIAVTPAQRAPPREPAALAVLGAATNRCRECPLGAGATQSVIGEGRIGARLMRARC